MILHCARKLAARLPDVSPAPLTETSLLGSWHGHLFHLDRRQCVLFMHDATRFALFAPGLRKDDFTALQRSFKVLFLATLARFGCPEARIARAELALGPMRFDTATDRSVLSSIRIAKGDLVFGIARATHVLDLDPLAVSHRLCHRPATIHGQLLWPKQAMLERIEAL